MINRIAIALTGSLLLQPTAAELKVYTSTFQNPAIPETLNKISLDDRLLKIPFFSGFHDGDICVIPPPVSESDIDFHRSLLVHDKATLQAANFSLRRLLQKLTNDVSGFTSTTPEEIFQQFWDTQNDATNAQTSLNNPHCSDNNGKINGFPLNNCPRPEGTEAAGSNADIANRIDDYEPVALVNRLDLADKGWKNCGEHRIIFARQNGNGQNLIIFEAVLPNPKPGCRSGCRDVIEFWTDLSNDTDPASRATKLSDFYFNGLTGFHPVVTSSHYSASGTTSVYGGGGSGQIRTNQFLFGGPWTLKEFKTLLSCAGGVCDYDFMPISVKGNPWGPLWNRDQATGTAAPPVTPGNPYATPVTGLSALAANFQADVISQVTSTRLGHPDINTFSYAVDPDKNAAESQSGAPTIDHYPNQFNSATDPTFINALDAAASGVGLTGDQVVNRATALSCAGCHEPPAFGLTSTDSIGPGQSWPDSLSFVHVGSFSQSLAGDPTFDPAHFGGNTQGFPISPALRDTFLPARRTVLTNLANNEVCNCVSNVIQVPEPPHPIEPPFLPIPVDILKFSEELTWEAKAALAELEEHLMEKKVSPAEQEEIFDKQKSILHNMEDQLEKRLAEAGIELARVPQEPQPVILPDTKEPTLKLKTEVVKRLVNSQPPRETITGSFRTH